MPEAEKINKAYAFLLKTIIVSVHRDILPYHRFFTLTICIAKHVYD